MKAPAATAVAAGAVFAAALVKAGCCGAPAGSGAGDGAGGVVDTPPLAAKAFDTIVMLAGFSPAPVARTVIVPAARVERIATRLMPASKSRNGWFVESIFPLL